MSEIKEKYSALKRAVLTEEGSKNLLYLKMFVVFMIMLNYLFVFTDIYIHIYGILPDALYSKYLLINASLPKIEKAMIYNADLDLFSKYTIFSIINLFAALVVPLFALSCIKMTTINKQMKNIFAYFLYCLLFLTSLLFFVLLFNGAGYNNPRFPIYPTLGRGEFFFIRDTGFFLVIGLGAVELIIMGFLAFRQTKSGGRIE